MKKIACLLFLLLLLTGCGVIPPESSGMETAAPETTVPVVTEPQLSWVEAMGSPWDKAGALVELPLNIPDGMAFTSCMEFDGDLLFWCFDHHLAEDPKIELCLFDLDTGTVSIRKEVSLGGWNWPQVLKDRLYLFSDSGRIMELDTNLEILNTWETGVENGDFTMGSNETVYVDRWDADIFSINLETMERSDILGADIKIRHLDAIDGYLHIYYYHPDNGEYCVILLDLTTGQLLEPPVSVENVASYCGGTWLYSTFEEGVSYALYPENGQPMETFLDYGSIRLMENDKLLFSLGDGTGLSIHDLSGKYIAGCILTEQPEEYSSLALIYNENFGGYFVIWSNYDNSIRLLFWDTDLGTQGDDLELLPIPEPDEQEAQIRSRVASIEKQYGLCISFGEDAPDYYYDFEAEAVTDWEALSDALDTLENALSVYPEGFFRQLRYGEIYRTEICLTGSLTAITEQYTDSYVAFVQEEYDSHILVADIYLADESTYYHEFSHIIDSYLEWDSQNREDALFSDDAWCSFNPDWFQGYTYDYSWKQYVEDYSAFVDDYSTISPTEDRARVLEFAMAKDGSWMFEGCEILQEKLSYYCRCIRDSFDTTGWPETVVWERYLP